MGEMCKLREFCHDVPFLRKKMLKKNKIKQTLKLTEGENKHSQSSGKWEKLTGDGEAGKDNSLQNFCPLSIIKGRKGK